MSPRSCARKGPMPDRTILVTGVAGTVGSFLVNELLADNWCVCGLDRESPANGKHGRFSFQQCELSDGADTEKKIEVFHAEHGAFDAVINCAGLIANSPLVSFVNGRLTHH